MKHTSRWRMFPAVTVGVILCAVGLFWPSSRPSRPLTVAVTLWPGMETLLQAGETIRAQGNRISFIELSWSTAATGAFRKRVVDASIVSLDELLRLQADGARPLAVLVLGISSGSDAVIGRPPMKSIADLRGKRVGVELRSSGEHLLARALAQAGMSAKDVEVVPLNLAETETAYDSREVDAVVATDPWSLRLRDRGAPVLYDSSALGLELARVLVVREQAARQHAAAIEALLSAYFQRIEHVAPASQLEATLRRQGLTAEQWQRAQQAIRVPSWADNLRLLQPDEGELQQTLVQMAGKMHHDGIIPTVMPVEAILHAEFAERSGP